MVSMWPDGPSQLGTYQWSMSGEPELLALPRSNEEPCTLDVENRTSTSTWQYKKRALSFHIGAVSEEAS
jgi:hypothetical protein